MELRLKLMVKDIFLFSMCHFYKTILGGVSVACTIMVVGIVAATWHSQAGMYRAILVVGMIFVALCQPLTLYRKAVKQVKDPVAGKELFYKMDYNGLHVQQGKEKANIHWNQIVKIGRIPGVTVFYLNKSRAYLFPDWALSGGKKEQLVKILDQYVPKAKRRGI